MARKRQTAPEGLPLPTGRAGGVALMASLAMTIALLVLGGAAYVVTRLAPEDRPSPLVVAPRPPTLHSAALSGCDRSGAPLFVHVDKKYKWPTDRTPDETDGARLKEEQRQVGPGRRRGLGPLVHERADALGHGADVKRMPMFLLTCGDAGLY